MVKVTIKEMVKVTIKDIDALCFDIVDGGPSIKIRVVIGGHLIKNNLLQLGIQSMRIGFTYSLVKLGIHNF